MIFSSDFDRLRRMFRGLALVLPLASAPATLSGCSCPDRDSDILFLLRDPDVNTQMLLDACLDPARQDCLPLCQTLAAPESTFDPPRIDRCELRPSNDGYAEVHVVMEQMCVGGRLTEGIRLAGGLGRPVAAFWTTMAELEAASVPSFGRLGRELRAHRAPAVLRWEARRAIDDERRHARVVTGLARRWGGRPQTPAAGRLEVRDLEAMAIENAAEGCVREAYGALVAAHQAARALDPSVRAAMRRIAVDEARHALLALAVDRWATGRVSGAARRRVRDAQRSAARELQREVEHPLPRALTGLGGLPEPPAARLLAAGVAALAEEAG